jgi:outer membrane protein OmpA-like peptidoglycan-associated protein
MRHLVPITLALALGACAGAQSAQSTAPSEQAGAGPDATSETPGESADNEFVIRDSDGKSSPQRDKPSKIKPTETEAALKFFLVDKDKGPIEGIVIAVTAPDGKKYYTEQTDADGYAELLVPVGQKYDLVYLSLGRRDIAANVSVSNEPRQNLRLTLRYKRYDPPPANGGGGDADAQRFVLDGVNFDSGKATIRTDSFPRLDNVVEYMTHKPGARIEISGHTDNVGNPKGNKALSLKRAQACRDYLISKGVDAGRITAVGHGDERPIAPNDTDDGRQKNRRIEAIEL